MLRLIVSGLSVLSASPFNIPPPGLPPNGGTVTGEVSLNEGFESTGDYDPVCSSASTRFDYDGVQSCNAFSDVVPDNLRELAASAYPLAASNTTGGNLVLRPGSGVHKAAMTAASWVNNTTTFTVTIDGTANTGTEGTAFECNSVSNTVCADNVANYFEGLAAAAGVHACSSGSTTTCTSFGFTGVAGTAYFFPAPEDSPGKFIDSIACSTGAAATLTNGTNGTVKFSGVIQGNLVGPQLRDVTVSGTIPGIIARSDATNTGIGAEAAGNVNAVANGTNAFKFGSGGNVSNVALTSTGNFTASSALIAAGEVKDVVNASCTAGEIMIDTGGATVEICVCTASNTERCVATTTTNPAD